MENISDPRLLDWLEAQKKIINKQENKQTQIWTLREQIATMYNKIESEKIDGYVEKKDKDKDEDKDLRYIFTIRYGNTDRTPDLLYKKDKKDNYKYLVKTKNFRKNKEDNVLITKIKVSPKYDIAAIILSHSGSDWREVYFFDLQNGTQLNDTLKFLRSSSQIIWHEDGVYYDRYNKPVEGRELLDKATHQSLFYHKLGSSQSEDVILFPNPDTTGTYNFQYFKKDSTKLFFKHFYPSRGKIYKALSYAPINNNKSIYLKNFLIYPNEDSINFNIEYLIGDTVILSTTWDAPKGKVLKANLKHYNKLEKLVPEYDAPLLSTNKLGKDKVASIYRKDGQYFVLIHNLEGELLKKIDFPLGKSVNYFYEYDTTVEYTDFCISSFYHPDLWYQLSLKDFTFKPSFKITVPYDAKNIETRYIKYSSKDGTEIPMYITCLKDIKLDGNNPVLLYGYGGYGVTINPYFNESTALWLLHGGILAIPNIRGGGEEGSEWGKEGRRLKKQNTINDFIGAAEYLINENYTNPDKLAIRGSSHGGMLVGAALTQRPELFKAAIAEAGVFDMLRFEKYTVGGAISNVEEFGITNNLIDYKNLKSYSPLYNIKNGMKYPNVLLITGDNDDRVPPFQSYKFLAALQEHGDPTSLYQLYIVPGAGHSGALTQDDWINKMLFEYYFLFDQLDLKFW
jgi:prolyl oligopeptidase